MAVHGPPVSRIDEESRGQLISHVMLTGELHDILFGGMLFVIDFGPINDGKDVGVVADLFLCKVPKRRNEIARRDTFIVEKPPGRLRDGEGFFDAGGHRQPRRGRLGRLHGSPNQPRIPLFQPFVRQIDG